MSEIEPRTATNAGDSRLAPSDVLWLSVSLGVGAGLVHATTAAVRQHLLHQFVWQGRNLVWMSPLGYLLIMAVPALVLSLLALLRWRAATWRLAVTTLGFLAFFGVGLLARGLHWAAILLIAAGAAWRFGAMIRADPLEWRKRLYTAALVLIAVTIIGGAGASVVRARLPARPAPAENAPNVLLIILDTVRAASMSLYGYGRATTPSIDTLAQSSVVFNDAMVPAPWTLPSHASMFTGQLPEALSVSWRRPLDRAFPTVAESFRDAGYATGGFVANPYYTAHESGLGRGFDVYCDEDFSLSQVFWSTTIGQTPLIDGLIWSRSFEQAWRTLGKFDLTVPREARSDRRLSEEVIPEFLRWHESLGTRPFFAFVNLFDAHDPYEPPFPWRRQFSQRPDKQARYDGGIAYMDNALGALFAELRRRKVLDRTIVVITSDHGEQFGEHDLHNHGNSLYLPLLHVPLIVRYPARVPEGLRIDGAITTRDLAVTMLDLAGIPNRNGLPGASLLRMWDDSVAKNASAVVAQTERTENSTVTGPSDRGDMAAILDGRLHFIRNGDGSFELYDYRADPRELSDLARTASWCDSARVLDAALRGMLARPSTSPYPSSGCPQ
ncbi:MAG: hypothetical protein MNPFHGCM_02021 [Gemmatimonadaceae bacterium]|nr:hypothetical protein [Gemmatimonadaceae bacterium]